MGTRGEERLKAITDAATEVVAERGYYGMTIQEVSDRVGITQAGLLKYVKNKNGLLMLVLRRYEDSSEAGDYIQSKLALTPEQRELSPLLMPEYYRTIAEGTTKRPQLTQLYLVLRAEAIDPNHPAHEHGTPSVADGCARRSAAIRGSCRPNITPRRRSGCCRCASARPWRACNPAGLASQTSTSCPAGPEGEDNTFPVLLAPTGTATAEPAFHSGYSPIVSTAATICVTVPVFSCTSSRHFFTNGCG